MQKRVYYNTKTVIFGRKSHTSSASKAYKGYANPDKLIFFRLMQKHSLPHRELCHDILNDNLY